MSTDVKITSSHLRVYGINFFRANSPVVLLGSVGEKKTPLTQQNYLAVDSRVPAPKLKVRKATTLVIDSSTATEKNLEVSVNVPLVGKLNAATASQQLRDDKLKLVLFEVTPRDIVDAANASPKVIDELQRIGDGGRLVHQIVVALEAKTATSFSNSASLDVTASVSGLKISAQGGLGSSGSISIELDPGTTFAYLLLKPKWDANQKKNWTRIVDWEDDQWSMN